MRIQLSTAPSFSPHGLRSQSLWSPKLQGAGGECDVCREVTWRSLLLYFNFGGPPTPGMAHNQIGAFLDWSERTPEASRHVESCQPFSFSSFCGQTAKPRPRFLACRRIFPIAAGAIMASRFLFSLSSSSPPPPPPPLEAIPFRPTIPRRE